ncbi:MAG TPA: RNA polymerase sigma factor [Terracidiphilus sp.]|nr:RNA polymerase sigma factor [Terracidiphilus sp.]
MANSPSRTPPIEIASDQEIVARVLQGDSLLFEVLMRRHNQRIYRAIRSIIRDDSECEEVMQESYVRAFEHLAQFEGRALFSTWLTRIAVNEAIKRSIARGKLDPMDLEDFDGENGAMLARYANTPTPESNAARSELTSLLEESILALPVAYRSVLVLRDLEEMSTAETAQVLTLTDANVKVRLHRAHEMLRSELMERAGASSAGALLFHATRCDRVVHAVFERLQHMAE